MPCPVVEATFGSHIHWYTHAKLGPRTILRANAAVTMPAYLAPHIATVAPLIRLPSVRQPILVQETREETAEEHTAASTWKGGCGKIPVLGLGCGTFVTPAILSQRYHLGEAPSGKANVRGPPNLDP